MKRHDKGKRGGTPKLAHVVPLAALAKPQWVAILEAMKAAGGMAVPELAAELGLSYMGTKQHCQKLTQLGYLETWRVPRTEVGRPELMYRLSPAGEGLFPMAGIEALEVMLDAAARLFGPAAPEKLVHHYLHSQGSKWRQALVTQPSPADRLQRLVDLRARTGCLNRCREAADGSWLIEEFHHPLRPLFERWPGLRVVELRILEELLGTRIARREIHGPGGRLVRVEFCLLSPAAAGAPRAVSAENQQS